MHKVVFIADAHLAHGGVRSDGSPRGILAARKQFKTEAEHDSEIIANIDAVANPTDTLVLAGDIVIGTAGYELIKNLQCRNKILVAGNHDGERARIEHYVYQQIRGAYEFKYQGLWFVVTHIPVHPSQLDRWDVNVHGHLHEDEIDDCRYICISAEQTDYQPVTKEWIYQRYLAKGGVRKEEG